jgi:hypothetical protein
MTYEQNGFPWTQPGAAFDFGGGPDSFNERAERSKDPWQVVKSHIRLEPRRCRGVADGEYELVRDLNGGWIAKVTAWMSLPFSVAGPGHADAGTSTAWGETPHEAIRTALMSL